MKLRTFRVVLCLLLAKVSPLLLRAYWVLESSSRRTFLVVRICLLVVNIRRMALLHVLRVSSNVLHHVIAKLVLHLRAIIRRLKLSLRKTRSHCRRTIFLLWSLKGGDALLKFRKLRGRVIDRNTSLTRRLVARRNVQLLFVFRRITLLPLR